MSRLPLFISGLTETTGRLSGLAGQILQDRLELLALELREAKIRLIQAWLLACMAMVFSLIGILLLVVSGMYVLPPEWRIYGLLAVALVSLMAGLVIFMALSRHLSQKPRAFDQSIAELKKDMSCFSTKK